MWNYEVAASGVIAIDALLDGYKWQSTQGESAALTYSFPEGNANFVEGYAEPAAGWVSFSADDRAATREVFEAWSDVAGLRFSEVDESEEEGDIRLAYSNLVETGQAAGWAYVLGTGTYFNGDLTKIQPSSVAGDIWINPNVTLSDGTGSDGFATLLHEVGHALGLDHPFEGPQTLPADQDTSQFTLMSYTSYEGAGYLYEDLGDGYYSYYPLQPQTPMLYDIYALQYLYGANMETRAGDNTYQFETGYVFETVWDAGGTDTFDFSNQLLGVQANLQDGQFSSVGHARIGINEFSAAVDNLAIAFGALIENAIGSNYDDTIIGNPANNTLSGLMGNDYLDGADGWDTALLSGVINSYEFTAIEGGLRVVGEGADELINIEVLEFSDIRVDTQVLVDGESILAGQVFLGGEVLDSASVMAQFETGDLTTLALNDDAQYIITGLSSADMEQMILTPDTNQYNVGSGFVTAQDGLLALLQLDDDILSDNQLDAADINRDQQLNMDDVQAILAMASGSVNAEGLYFMPEKSLQYTGVAVTDHDYHGAYLGDINNSFVNAYLAAPDEYFPG